MSSHSPSRPCLACLCLASVLAAGCGDDGGAADAAPADASFVPAPDLADPARAGSLRIRVTDEESGLALPSRVLLQPLGNTPPVRFDRLPSGELTNGLVGTKVSRDVIGAPEGVLLLFGAAELTLDPGSYDLFITHGPEWEADERRVTVEAGKATSVEAKLRHSVDTRGWLAADLHVHAGRSFDSRLQHEARVISEVGVGVELIVATDHNVITDLQPDIEALGYQDVARAIIGDEFNFAEGHGGAYPMPYFADQPFGGTESQKLDWDSVKNIHAPQIFDFIHGFPTRPVVTVNHPRLLPDLGYFGNIDWAPPLALPTAARFDAVELLGGYAEQPEDLAQLVRDWFFLLSSGHRVTALGSSDTHKLRDVRAGFPRSLLRLGDDRPREVGGADLAEAIRAGRAIATNGPFATLTVEGRPIGEVVKTGGGGTVMVEAFVDAPGWIVVDKARVFVNGKLAVERALAPGTRPRLRESFPVPVPAGDAWVVLQVGGLVPLRDDLIGENAAGRVLPFAITNPVYLDGNGDGTWKPTFPRPEDADPGPLGPLGLVEGGGREPFDLRLPGRARRAGDDCEPPLFTDPRSFEP